MIKSDIKGIVILMIDDQITPAIAKQLLQGSADPLNSAFHLTYNMVLNLLRVEDINPEWLLSKSFYQFQHCNKVPGMITRLKELQVEKVCKMKRNKISLKIKIGSVCSRQRRRGIIILSTKATNWIPLAKNEQNNFIAKILSTLYQSGSIGQSAPWEEWFWLGYYYEF